MKDSIACVAGTLGLLVLSCMPLHLSSHGHLRVLHAYLWPWYHDLWLWVSFSYIHTWAGVPCSDMMILVGILQLRIFCMLHKEQVQCYVTSPEPMKPFDKTEKNRRRYVLPLLLKDLSWNKMSLFSVWLTFFF